MSIVIPNLRAAVAVPRWAKNELWRKALAVPSLDLRFADNKLLTDAITGANLVTFNRASPGTFVGSSGLIQSAVTNLLLRSEEFGVSWQTSNTTVSPNAIVAPNGTLTADKAIATTTNGAHQLFQITSGTSGVTYTTSFYVKAGEYNRFNFGPGNTAVGGDKIATINLSLSNPVVSQDAIFNSSAFATPVGNGWYRVGATFTATATGTMTLAVLQTIINNSGSSSFAGDNTSGIYLWGAQLEQASTVGEYIPTTSAINSAPRFDHNPTTGESLGLLVEEPKTNNLVQSEDFATTWTISNVDVSPNTVTAPDGTLTADTFGPVVGDGLTTTTRLLRQNLVLATQQAYTFSVFAKVGTATTNGIALFVSDQLGVINFRANFNLFNQTRTAASSTWAIPTATIVPYPNGWYRCILSGVTSTVHTGLRANIYLNAFGAGVSDTYGTHHIWGAQLEAGAFATSYIKNIDTVLGVTRAGDVASITGTNFSSFYNQTEGTVFAEGGPTNPTLNKTQLLLTINDGSANNRAYLGKKLDSTTTVEFGVASGGVGQAVILTMPSSISNARFTAGYKVNDFAVASSGGALASDTSGSVPVSNTQLLIGTLDTALNNIGGYIRRLAYWPTRLSNTTLQAISQ